MTVRRLAFDSLYNFRDLGGYEAHGGTTRWKMIFRADGLQRATQADVERMETLGLHTVIDLRTTKERDEDGDFGQFDSAIEYRHLPIFDGTEAENRPTNEAEAGDDVLVRLYHWMVTNRGDRLAAAIGTLIEAPGPVVYHCTAGKDRTGVMSALMLSVVGVDDEVIAHDYSLSREAMDSLVAWYRANRPRPNGEPNHLATEQAMKYLGAEPEWILRTLTFVRDNYGSVASYLSTIGIGEPEVKQLRAKLVM